MIDWTVIVTLYEAHTVTLLGYAVALVYVAHSNLAKVARRSGLSNDDTTTQF